MGYDLELVRASAPIEDVAGRHVEWDMRKSIPARREFWACCPFHAERTPSFKVDGAKGLFHCFGCGEGGDVFAFVQKIDGVDFATALKRLAEDGGVSAEGESPAERQARLARTDERRQAQDAAARRAAARKRRTAAGIWDAAKPDAPLLAEYLAARGVRVAPLREACGGALPASLRLHPDLEFYAQRPDGGVEVIHQGPAMIAAVRDGDDLRAIHRTWITRRGRATVEGRKLPKRMLGEVKSLGVAFGPPTARMVAGEGIETTLAVWSMLLERGETGWSAEAALSRDELCGAGFKSAAHIESERALGRPIASAWPDFDRPSWAAPDVVELLVILAEGSPKDPSTAENLTRRAVRRHAIRPNGRPRRCTFRLPGGRWDCGRDFADLAADELRAREARGA